MSSNLFSHRYCRWIRRFCASQQDPRDKRWHLSLSELTKDVIFTEPKNIYQVYLLLGVP